jgi:hypothetical protein
MKRLFLLVALLLARGSTLAQSDTIYIDPGGGLGVKSYLITDIDSITFFISATGIIDEFQKKNIPVNFEITQNFPNPFNPSTQIKCYLPSDGKVHVRIFDITGKLIKELFNGVKQAGENIFTWDGKNGNSAQVASGAYLFSVSFNNSQLTRKMIYLK